VLWNRFRGPLAAGVGRTAGFKVDRLGGIWDDGGAVSRLHQLFSFPNPVNEVSARTVAGCVALIGLVAISAHLPWLSAVLAFGFLARVASGPTLSPLGQLATRVIAPRLALPKLVAGPPKRFAQGIGATFTVTATITYFAFGLTTVTYLLLAATVLAATLESVFALCLGCRIFALLMRIGVVPEEVCAACADIWSPAARALRVSSATARDSPTQ